MRLRDMLEGHKSDPGFDPTKFTPGHIHNKKQLDLGQLKAYFVNHTLGDCAKHFGCSVPTIKRYLRTAGVDTSVHNHSELALAKHRDVVGVRKPTADELAGLYLPPPEGGNWDSKSIAELYGCHYNVIRGMLKRLGLWGRKTAAQKSAAQMNRHFRKHGVFHPAQRKDVLAKTRRSTVRYAYIDVNGRDWTFRSSHELAYALLLDYLGREWYYEDMSVPYVDTLSGKQRVYFIDFTVINGDDVEWVEIKPADDMIPTDKVLCAARQAEQRGVVFRGNTTTERLEAKSVLDSGYRAEFITKLPCANRVHPQRVE